MSKNGVIAMDVAVEEVKAAVDARGVLSKEAFLAAARPKLRKLWLETLGGYITFHELPRGEVSRIYAAHTKKDDAGREVRDGDGLTIAMIAASLVEPKFTEQEIAELYDEGTVPFWNEFSDLLLRENRAAQHEKVPAEEVFRATGELPADA